VALKKLEEYDSLKNYEDISSFYVGSPKIDFVYGRVLTEIIARKYDGQEYVYSTLVVDAKSAQVVYDDYNTFTARSCC
jgi:hypothetical protein